MQVEGEGMVMLSRRQWYPRFQKEAPPLDVPESGRHIWNWYMDATRRHQRVFDGVCVPITPTEWFAWERITGNIVYRWEYDILTEMDIAFCAEMNKELEAKRAVQYEQSKAKGKRGK